MCENCDYVDHLDKIDEMLLDEDYGFADETLCGIRKWVEENEHITEKQIVAIHNIQVKGMGE